MSKKIKTENELKKEIRKKFPVAIKNILEEINFDIESKYKYVIKQFYRHYGPIYYRRTYSLFLASNAYSDINKTIKKMNEKEYVVGINVSSSNYPNNPYHFDLDTVFTNAFERGIHGINESIADSMNKKNKYKISNIPPKMEPSPKGIMDDWWEKYTAKDNLYSIFRKHLNRTFKK